MNGVVRLQESNLLHGQYSSDLRIKHKHEENLRLIFFTMSSAIWVTENLPKCRFYPGLTGISGPQHFFKLNKTNNREVAS